MEMMLVLLGKPLNHKFPRKFIILYLVPVLFYSCIYQSNVSSESLHKLEFPPFQHFVKAGYKFVTPRSKLMIQLIGAMPAVSRRRIENLFGPIEQAFFDYKKLADWRTQAEWKNIIGASVKHKIYFASFLRPELFRSIKSDVTYFGDEILCNVYHLSEQSPYPLSYRYRMWSFLASRFYQVFTQMVESGIYGGIKKVYYVLKLSEMKDLGMRPANAVVPAKALELASVVGIACLGQCVVGVVALGIYVGVWICKLYKINGKALVGVWHRFHCRLGRLSSKRW